MAYRNFVKPIFDFAIAFVLILLVLPLLLVIALLLKVTQGGNPFFTQERIGFREKIFYVVKFKTMNETRGGDGKLLPDDQRLTRIGSWVRKTSLDELPQLINVLKGEMSFIGPRPLLLEYLPIYNEEQRKRHTVKPGISGWAQINGRNSITWKQKFSLDVWYVNHQSFWLDLKIVFITIFKILKAEGISGQGVATVEKFNGNN